MVEPMPWPVRVMAGHLRLLAACGLGLGGYWLLPATLGASARAVFAYDIGALALILLVAAMFIAEGDDEQIARHAELQQEGEWTVFGVTLAGVLVSFAALGSMLSVAKEMHGVLQKLYLATVAATLFLSWLVTHVVFALRYAHEYYERAPGAQTVFGGLQFPCEQPPDYWDFVYFALVLGMTFQVSDVQITSRKMRRLATMHGLIGFLFNTVIVALTVNIAASLI